MRRKKARQGSVKKIRARSKIRTVVEVLYDVAAPLSEFRRDDEVLLGLVTGVLAASPASPGADKFNWGFPSIEPAGDIGSLKPREPPPVAFVVGVGGRLGSIGGGGIKLIGGLATCPLLPF